MEHNKENINEWQQIEQSPESSEWNMVVVINQQNHLVSDQASSTNDPEDGASSPLTASSSESNEEGVTEPLPLDWRARLVDEGKKLLKVRLEGVRERVVGVASKVRGWAMCVGVFWSFTHVAGAAAAVLVLLVYVGIRRRRRRMVDRRNVVVDPWVYLLKEKDEKISQLLLQIAQLNEVLSSRRKVPVHQIN